MSIDGGLTWKPVEKDDYGRTIDMGQPLYEFNKDGLYRVVVEDNFRNGIDAVIAERDYLKPAPKGSLNGVKDGGYTNGAVQFVWTDEAFVRLTYDGKTSEYESGAELTEEGEYELEFTDANGYKRVFTFTIDKTAPVGELYGAKNGGITNKPVALEFAKDGADGSVYKHGILIGAYKSGTEITEDGEYKIVLTDRAGNATEYTFAIDTVKPEATLYGVENGGRTGGSVALKNPNKQADVKAYKNGAEFAYAFGDTLTQEGGYKIVLTDAAGNETVYEFEIVYAVNIAGTVVIIILIVLIGGGTAVVFIMRKRKTFKFKPKSTTFKSKLKKTISKFRPKKTDR
jgi:hypothetical protein